MTTSQKKYDIRFDPRTKLLLLLICVLSTSMAPSLDYIMGLILLISVFAMFCNKISMAIYWAIIYAFFYALSLVAMSYLGGFLQTTLIAFLGLVHKIYPCAFICCVIIKTTKISEFLSAMNTMRMPKTLTIPLAIMLRYIPTIHEDWCFIKDAMRLRDVSPTFCGLLMRPLTTLECVYVPLMMLASKAADDLSIASYNYGRRIVQFCKIVCHMATYGSSCSKNTDSILHKYVPCRLRWIKDLMSESYNLDNVLYCPPIENDVLFHTIKSEKLQ